MLFDQACPYSISLKFTHSYESLPKRYTFNLVSNTRFAISHVIDEKFGYRVTIEPNFSMNSSLFSPKY